jgi:predicted RNA-binding protein with TRAM domain
MLREGQKLKVELIRVTDDGVGIAVAKDGTLIEVENVNDDDYQVQVEITQIREESAIAKKIEGEVKERTGVIANPYESDDDSEVESNDEDDADE